VSGDEKVRVYVCGSVDENVRKERVEKKVLDPRRVSSPRLGLISRDFFAYVIDLAGVVWVYHSQKLRFLATMIRLQLCIQIMG